MAFSEDIKSQVKENSAFRCCRCQQIGVEVHHIVPQKDGGKDDIDNAAPLCPSCHAAFGDNPMKRKEILEMRDWWYGCVRKMYDAPSTDVVMLDKINSLVGAVERNSTNIEELKDSLRQYTGKIIERITPLSARTVATSVTSSSLDLTGSVRGVLTPADRVALDKRSIGEEASSIEIFVPSASLKSQSFDEGEGM